MDNDPRDANLGWGRIKTGGGAKSPNDSNPRPELKPQAPPPSTTPDKEN